MTPTLVGKQDVEILEVTGPRQLAVRPLSFSRHYERLQQQLRDEAQHLEKLIRVEPQQGCALYFENCWHRAMVEVSNNTSVEVRLVDLGRKTIASVDKLKKLPNHFLEDHAYCLLCHLPGCVDDDGSILETRSLKSTTTQLAVGGSKTFWEDQRAGDLKKRSPTSIFFIFEVFAFCGGRTKTDFKDRARRYRSVKQGRCRVGIVIVSG